MSAIQDDFLDDDKPVLMIGGDQQTTMLLDISCIKGSGEMDETRLILPELFGQR